MRKHGLWCFFSSNQITNPLKTVAQIIPNARLFALLSDRDQNEIFKSEA